MIQRTHKSSAKFGKDYTVDRSDDKILSAKNNLFCVDVQLFLDDLPQKLKRAKTQPEDSEDFADIYYAGSLPFDGGFHPKILVTVFTLRDSEQKLDPKYRKPPDWTDIKKHLRLSEEDENEDEHYSLPLDLSGNSKIDLIPHIILRNVEQLLSATALPDSAQPDVNKVYLINSLIRYVELEINYKATL
jgi:hypothetical protein